MNNTKIAVIGHGYVGLPLARLFATQYPIVGMIFKENCPDIRNTRAVDMYQSLKEYGQGIDIYDPWATPEEVLQEYGITSQQQLPTEQYDAIVLAVAHKDFLDTNLNNVKAEQCFVYDVKGVLENKDAGL